jgi:uncharacterized protein (DUF885 family)
MPLMKMVPCVAALAFCCALGLSAFAQDNAQASALVKSNPAEEPQTRAKVGFDSLSTLAIDFWQWRARYQPFSQDDIPRIERPGGRRDWSAAAITRQKTELADYERRWEQIDPSSWSVAQQVDYRLMGSAIARVRWELEINPRWQQDPTFYLDQTLTALLEAMLQPPPFSAERSREIIERMENITEILEAARENLHPIRPFAVLAIARLQQIRPEIERVKAGVAPMLATESASEGDRSQAPRSQTQRFETATDKAIVSLESYRSWLESQLSAMPVNSAVGRDKYEFFLHRVALLPFTPEELLSLSQQEWDRSVAFEQYEEHRNQGLPQLPIAANLNDEIDRGTRQELAIRKFLEEKNILTVPANIRHYTLRPTPDYLNALEDFGELDDFTGPSRLQDDGVRWIPEPSPQLGFFWLATAKDPRPDMVHEGVPGHYFQMCLSWTHPDPIRRHYYDSGANEGLGFYAEEMMLQAGLFDDQPRTWEIIYKFMRLRALRVEVDVKLALGTFSISQAADYLAEHVPMDKKTAEGEAALFATTPGQAISYQVGKSQIMHFLARSRLSQGDKFDLRGFHDFLWLNGNVPIALQRWEYLGEDEDVRALNRR